MKRSDAERLLLSVIIAAVLFGAAAVVLYFVELPSIQIPEYKGPVFLTIEEITPAPAPAADKLQPAKKPEPGSEPLVSADRGEPEEPQPEGPRSAEPLQEEERTTEPREAESEQGAETPSPENPETAPGDNRQPEAGTGDAGAPRPEEAEVSETAGTDTGTAETEPLPSGGFEETASPEEAEEEGLVGADLMTELDAAIAGTGDEAPGAAGETGPDSAAGEADALAGGVPQLGTAGNPIDFDTLTANRKPISLPQPEIDPELATGLPTVFKVVISFTLLPSGHITDLNITPDSGNTEVDSIIQKTIRKWRFEPVTEDAGPVQVRVRYNIRVR